jgi:alanyl-tRNA synthetase
VAEIGMEQSHVAFDRLKCPPGLPGTRKRFADDPLAREAGSTVLHVDGEFVILDATVFYPESGGQEWDEGTIDGSRVVDVQDQGGRLAYLQRDGVHVPAVKVDTLIVHRLAAPAPFGVGARVDCTIDWERRYALMRSHSAGHFLFHALRTVYAQPGEELFLKGCHIDRRGFRFDFAADLSGDRLADAETLANELIARGDDIVMEPDPDCYEVFYWRYGDIVIPCGGTHVGSARELAPITVRRQKKGAGVTRFYGEFVGSAGA